MSLEKIKMPIWWEKTVEYTFVLSLGEASRLFLAPLDGDHERAGDAMISAGSKWLLIEFKRDIDAIRSEVAKFENYADAKAALGHRDGHHFLVYGVSTLNDRVSLGACTYFSHMSSKSLAVLLAAGSDLANFSEYVESFVAFKKGTKGGGGSGQQFADFALVAGVTEEGKVVSCMSVRDFGLARGLDLMKAPERTRSMGGPSR
jgi:hypothetical protein